MTIADIVDHEVMRHLALFGCIKHADPLVQHMLKHSQEPILRFRRSWMRRTALQQHLEAERRQKKINDQTKREPLNKRSSMWRTGMIDPQLNAEMLHYNKTNWQDKGFIRDVKSEAPAIFPKRD